MILHTSINSTMSSSTSQFIVVTSNGNLYEANITANRDRAVGTMYKVNGKPAKGNLKWIGDGPSSVRKQILDSIGATELTLEITA